VNKKIAKTVWLVIIILFIGMEIYHVVVGNYDDLALSLLIVIVPLSVLGVYFLIKKSDRK